MNKENLAVIIVDYNSISKTLNYIIDLHQFIESDFNIHYVVVENYERPLKKAELAILGHDWIVQEERTKNYQKKYSLHFANAMVDILWTGINSGFAVGNNIGTLYANKYFQPTCILYSNNDITFSPEFNMEGMVEILKSDDKAAAVGPCVVGIDGHRQGPAKKTGYIWGLLLHDFVPDKYKKETELIKNPERGYVYWVAGCFMLVSTEKICKAGLFDEHTFLYCEEMILAERFLSHGWYFYYDDRVSITHEGGTTISKHTTDAKQLQMKFASRLYYYRKYMRLLA